MVDPEFGWERDDSDIDVEIVKRYGLLYPITVSKELTLLAGGQWLSAVKKLGWPLVEVLIMEATP
jgi:ParB-like chromosome segregation protein Spo0J